MVNTAEISKKIILFCLMFVFAATPLFIFSQEKAFAAAAQCNVQSPIGGGVGGCYPVPGYEGTFEDDHCYEVVLGTEVRVTEKPCNEPPFADNWMITRCADGTYQSGTDTTAEQLCAEHGGLPIQTITCLDGTRVVVSHGADDAAKIAACESHCGYNTEGGSRCTEEELQQRQNLNTGGVAVENVDRNLIRNCDGSTPQGSQNCLAANPLVIKIGQFLDFLSAVVAIAVIGSIIAGGIQYSASHGDPNVTAKAKKRITNALTAFVAYIFLYAFIQWLIPGGVF